MTDTDSRTAYQAFNTSISTAKLIRKGLKAHIGAHGEPPLGVNYHAEMFFTRQGGLTNYEVSWNDMAFFGLMVTQTLRSFVPPLLMQQRPSGSSTLWVHLRPASWPNSSYTHRVLIY